MKNNKIISLILTISLIAVWGSIGYQVLSGMSTGENESDNADLNSFKNSNSIRYEYKEDVKDPFQLVPSSSKKVVVKTGVPRQDEQVWVPPPYRLSGIVADRKKRLAILESNDGGTVFLGEGDSLNGLMISKIEEKKVLFSYMKRNDSWKIE